MLAFRRADSCGQSELDHGVAFGSMFPSVSLLMLLQVKFKINGNGHEAPRCLAPPQVNSVPRIIAPPSKVDSD